jgi:hypothetical protein
LFIPLRALDLAGGEVGGPAGLAGSTLSTGAAASSAAGGRAVPGVGGLGTGVAGAAWVPLSPSSWLVAWWIRRRWTAANSSATPAARKLDKTIA